MKGLHANVMACGALAKPAHRAHARQDAPDQDMGLFIRMGGKTAMRLTGCLDQLDQAVLRGQRADRLTAL